MWLLSRERAEGAEKGGGGKGELKERGGGAARFRRLERKMEKMKK